MKRNRIQNRCLATCLMFIAMLMTSVGVNAQNVTIKATNGSTIPAVKNGGTTDSFFPAGGFATWQHQQLSMVLTVSDGTTLTAHKQLDNPANNLFKSNDGKCIQIGKGKAGGANVCYVSLSLPSGYRFTGYEIKFRKSTETKTLNTSIDFNSSVTSRFGETGSDFNTYVTRADVTNTGGSKTIARTEGAGGTMGNVLYFKLMNPNNANSRALITLESAEFFFTAEENYAPVTPAGEITSPVSAVDIPFSTSKVDYGPIQERSYQVNGRTYKRISYSSADVKDLEANFVLYEADSYKNATASETFDGTAGRVVDYKDGSISSNGGYFQLGSGNANVEQVYYIESPTYVTLSNGTKNPIGYRIVGAEFEYNTSVAQEGFYIIGTIDDTKYYLNTDGRFTTTPIPWEIDADGYISSNGLYLYWYNNYCATQTDKPGSGERFTIDNNGRIYQTEYTSYYIRIYEQNGTYFGLITTDNYGSYATKEDLPPISTGNFTLNVYDKTGVTPHTIPVSGHGTYKIEELMNNDAVKFGVKGTGLVRATLTLQALDPYLYSMNVVCQDQEEGFEAIRLTQNFTASDFSVSGGVFHFFMPQGTEGHGVKITFEDLVSNYFDDSYTGGNATHTSRINFVKSAHYNAFGNSTDNVNNIYTNTSEASNAQLERLKVGIVGTRPFLFNNAASVGTSGGTLTEYPFTLAKYAASPNNGGFEEMEFTVSAQDQNLVRYVFTTDETRYNIAPTTAVQHRAYAYYEMDVHVMTATYTPKVEFVKVYDETFYYDTEGKKDKTDAFYGVKVTAIDSDNNPGYASTIVISDRIANIINNTKVDDFNHTDLPSSKKQILYLDLSEMKGIYMMTDENHPSMEAFVGENATNCLVFLPKGSSAQTNNVAYKMESGNFHAANDIVITDKQPFFTPYDINVGSEKKSTYTRLFTTDDYGKEENATIMLPFTLYLEDGVHTNEGGNCTFTVHTMKSGAQMSTVGGSSVNYGTAFFQPATTQTTVANKPYMVHVDFISPTELAKGISFIATQKGASISATTFAQTPTGPNEEDNNKITPICTGKLVKGETATGKFGESTTYTFTNYASYSGGQFDRAVSEDVFYFSNDKYVDLHTLWPANKRYLKSYPFRGVYTYSSSRGANAKSMSGFYISYNLDEMEEIEGLGIATNINEVGKNADLMIRSDKGMLTISANRDQNVTIRSINGIAVKDVNINAGDTKTVGLPSGIYLVNNIKITVK